MMRVAASATANGFLKQAIEQNEKELILSGQGESTRQYQQRETRTQEVDNNIEVALEKPNDQQQTFRDNPTTRLKCSTITRVPSAKNRLKEPVATRSNGLSVNGGQRYGLGSCASGADQSSVHISKTTNRTESLQSLAAIVTSTTTPPVGANRIKSSQLSQRTTTVTIGATAPQRLVSPKVNAATSVLPRLSRKVDSATCGSSNSSTSSLHAPSRRSPPIASSLQTTNHQGVSSSCINKPLQQQQQKQRKSKEAVKQRILAPANSRQTVAQQKDPTSRIVENSINPLKDVASSACYDKQASVQGKSRWDHKTRSAHLII